MFGRIAAIVACLCGSTAVSHAGEKAKTVEIAICLDTSGSMEGLIESAKIQLWTIVNQFARVQPTPVLRVALYQYGNDGLTVKSGWVRKEIELTNDLDEVYKKLSALSTNGGTELVARVTQTALRELAWSREDGALRLLFVCGNEPADQDKEVALRDVAEAAKKRGVLVNTIYCGSASSSEVPLWREFAVVTGGRYSNIDMSRATKEVAIATPFDKDILELNSKLNGTYVAFGREGAEKLQNQAKQDTNAAKAKPEAALSRASTKASGLYSNGHWDLIDRIKADPRFDIRSIGEAELCDEMKKLTPDERVEYVKKKAAERATICKGIETASGKRAKYIADEKAKAPKPTDGDKSLDDAFREMIREQAATKGIEIR